MHEKKIIFTLQDMEDENKYLEASLVVQLLYKRFDNYNKHHDEKRTISYFLRPFLHIPPFYLAKIMKSHKSFLRSKTVRSEEESLSYRDHLDNFFSQPVVTKVSLPVVIPKQKNSMDYPYFKVINQRIEEQGIFQQNDLVLVHLEDDISGTVIKSGNKNFMKDQLPYRIKKKIKYGFSSRSLSSVEIGNNRRRIGVSITSNRRW